MRWWTILIADLLCSLVVGTALWVLAFGEVANLAAQAIEMSPVAMLADLLAIRLR